MLGSDNLMRLPHRSVNKELEMKNILFVDDEVNILNGLKRMLNSKKKEWHMVFATSGGDGLKALTEETFDIVVSDMRMPNMDGVKFLTTVKEKYPGTTRIALSGYSKTEMVLDSILSTHLFISKPTDFETLSKAIERCLSIQEIIANEMLCNLFSGINSLPSIPEIYKQLLEELASEEVSIESVGNIIEKDIGMSAKLLQIVNSAYFGLSRDIKSTKEAVSHLGLDIIQSIVLSTKIFEAFENESNTKELNHLLSHSQAVLKMVRKIAKSENIDKENSNVLFTASLLQDIGKLVIMKYFPEPLRKEFSSCLDANSTLEIELERKVFGVSHEKIGAYILHLWGIPLSVVECVAYHHGGMESIDVDNLKLHDILYISNLIISNSHGETLPLQDRAFDNFKFQEYFN
jgi:putative nucleotidyltransferase with HDIG domain